MNESLVVAESAKKIVEDLTREKNQVGATIESLESRLISLRGKISEIDSAIAILVDTYKLKSRASEVNSVTEAPVSGRGRRKSSDTVKLPEAKKKKPVEIKTAVREYITANLNFPVKELVAAIRRVRPDVQQPSIQAELTKLMKADELERVGYGQYHSKLYAGKGDVNASASTEAGDTLVGDTGENA